MERRLSEVLSEFARTLITDFPIQAILDHLVGRIVDVLPVDAAGVTLISPGAGPRYVAASDDSALRFERLQCELGEGPCILAYESGEPVAVADLHHDERFPNFTQRALDEGLAAVFTYPLHHGDWQFGALDLYRRTPGPLHPGAEAAAQTLADVASAYLLNAWARDDLERASDLALEGARSLAEAQSIAHVGSWELDLATQSMTWSDELYRLLGFDRSEEPSRQKLFSRFHLSDRAPADAALDAALADLTPLLLDIRLLLPDGTKRCIRAEGRLDVPATDLPARFRCTAHDVTEQRLQQESLAHQAVHDPLTGLPNRLLLLDRLSQALERLSRHPTTLAVIFLDIDRFKVVNDSLGHAVGDQMLVALADRLTALLRPGDTVARFGGDEFIVLCEGLAGEADGVGVAARISDAMAEPIAWDGGELVVTVSAGIAFATSSQVSAEALLRDADAALYGAKGEGRAKATVFAEPIRSSAIRRLDTEVALRRSIANGDFRVHYQPIVDLVSGARVGHEALVRWQHPERGLIGPDEFIPVAEETGLIGPLGEWVLDRACEEACLFQRSDPRWSELTMAVNLSGYQINQPDLVGRVETALVRAGLRPGCLQLEITESVLMRDAASAITILHGLRDLGVRLAVDDFGTGFSSLSYLTRFPVDVLKIDRSFVDGLGRDPDDSAIAAAVVSLAMALDLEAIAEGIETGLQADQLLNLGCTRGQGFYYGRPVPSVEAQAALDAETVGGGASPVVRSHRSGRVTVFGDGGEVTTGVSSPTQAAPVGARAAADPVAAMLRSLLRIRSAKGAAELLQMTARQLGASLVPATEAGPDALPIDLSLGEGVPLVAVAEPFSLAGMQLERMLPRLAEDARQAINLLRHQERLEEESNHDVLTGLANRRVLDRILPRADDGVVIMIDLDHFKKVNDTRGHAAGDEVLSEFGRMVIRELRAGDTCCRVGGEEFAVVATGTEQEDALDLIGRLRSSWAEVAPFPVTFSAGVAVIASGGGPAALVAADRALYRAKELGRNRTEVADPYPVP